MLWRILGQRTRFNCWQFVGCFYLSKDISVSLYSYLLKTRLIQSSQTTSRTKVIYACGDKTRLHFSVFYVILWLSYKGGVSFKKWCLFWLQWWNLMLYLLQVAHYKAFIAVRTWMQLNQLCNDELTKCIAHNILNILSKLNLICCMDCMLSRKSWASPLICIFYWIYVCFFKKEHLVKPTQIKTEELILYAGVIPNKLIWKVQPYNYNMLNVLYA